MNLQPITEVYIVRSEYIPTIVVPFPFLNFYITPANHATTAEMVEEYNEPFYCAECDRAYIAFTRHEIEVGQVIAGCTVKEKTEGIFYLQAKKRLKITEIVEDCAIYAVATAEEIDRLEPMTAVRRSLMKQIQTLCQRLKELNGSFEGQVFLKYNDLGSFVDLVAALLIYLIIGTEELRSSYGDVFGFDEQEKILFELSSEKRARHLYGIIQNTICCLEEELGIPQKNNSETSGNKKGSKTVARAVGNKKYPYDEWKEKIDQLNLPKEVLQEVGGELEKLWYTTPNHSEYSTTIKYLGWICRLPWNKSSDDCLDLIRVRQVLDEDHYNLEQVKKRIKRYLAVRKLNPNSRGAILCFIGPPGTGKTSICKSIARAMGREYIRLSLGACSGEEKIKGHNRTFVAAQPGNIIKCIAKAGVNNPVFVLDEIEKVGHDPIRGDPADALLEALDSEQNYSFKDNYIDAPFDLSKVFFIATGNIEDTIHPALRDRMEIIHFEAYTLPEKLHIAKRHLIPKQLKAAGLRDNQVSLGTEVIERIISLYTDEAGVRNLERQIETICGNIAEKVVCGEADCCEITVENLREFLGVEKYLDCKIKENPLPGEVVILAVIEGQGKIFRLQAAALDLSDCACGGEVVLTGSLGEVMRESASVALTLIQEYGKFLRESFLDPGDDANNNFQGAKKIHIHAPEGAVPKEGPSAGVAIVIALASCLLEIPVRGDLAMTGEIDLHGNILAIGGVAAKIDGAKRAGVKEIIVPLENIAEIEEMKDEQKEGLIIHPVSHIEEVFDIVFEENKEEEKKR